MHFHSAVELLSEKNMTKDKFMVQIVLHESMTPAAYDVLNLAMSRKGFASDLSGKKASYHLPLGSYWYEGDLTPNDVRMLACEAADTTGRDYGILVIRANGWSVMRLKRVQVTPQE
jgi:hypothetical protein